MLEGLDGYGRCLGLAFQITDDLLDAVGAPGRWARRPGRTPGVLKLTYPGLLGVAESRRATTLGEEARHWWRSGPAARRLDELVTFVLTRDR
ncbi:MAG: hypothetical protein U0797_21320 [Gemmataceae bacterium]